MSAQKFQLFWLLLSVWLTMFGSTAKAMTASVEDNSISTSSSLSETIPKLKLNSPLTNFQPEELAIVMDSAQLDNSGITKVNFLTSQESKNTDNFYLTQNRNLPPFQPITPRPPEPLPEEIPQPQPNPLEPVTPTPPTQSPNLGNSPTITVERFEFEGNTAFSDEELTNFLQNFIGEPLTFSQLLELEAKITKKYVSAGYINSGAVIPSDQALDPDGAVVTIRIIEGGVEEINITGTQRLNPGYVSSRLALATDQPLDQSRILEALQLLQLNPLIDELQAELAAGTRPESSVLNVNVTEADSFRVEGFIDNGRTPSVGSFRRGITLQEGNLFGIGDKIVLEYANTDGSNAGDIAYSVPVSPHNTTLNFGFGIRDTEVVEPPFDDLDIKGDSIYYEIGVRQPIIEKPTEELALGLTFSRQESQTELLGVDFPLSPGAEEDGETKVTAIRFFQEWTQRDLQQLFAVRSQFSLGVDAFDATVNDDEPDGRFFAWRGQAQYVRLLAPETLLVVRSDLQLSTTGLVSLERIGVGGLNSVRGYRQDQLLTDNGIFASAEVRVPIVRFAKDEGLLQVVPFIDFGTGWNDDDNTDPDDQTLLGVGVGLQLDVSDWLSARFDWGIPIIDVDSRDRTIQEDGFYFSLIVSPF